MYKEKNIVYGLHTAVIIHVKLTRYFGYTYVVIIRLNRGVLLYCILEFSFSSSYIQPDSVYICLVETCSG